MQNNDTLYLKSSNLIKTQSSGDYHKLTHLISGRQFEVCENTLKILDYFSTANTIEMYRLSKPIHSSIKHLIDDGFLIDLNQQLHHTFHTHLPNKSLFVLPIFDSNKTGQLAFIGVPFGGGNPSSPEPGRFPAFLRSFVENYKINLNSDQNINYNCLGNKQHLYHITDWIGSQLLRDAGDVFIHHFESRQSIYEKITFIFEKVIATGNIPFGIGGDHSITYPILKAIAKHHTNFSVLHFDAHTDLYDSDYEPLLDENNLHHHGNFVKKCLKIDQLNHYHQFGIRGINNIGHSFKHQKLSITWIDQIRRHLKDSTISPLRKDEKYYITFDIDVLDPSIAPGTGTPVPNGLLWDEIIQLLCELGIQHQQIIGIDLVEINAKKDEQNITTSLAVQLILNLLNFIKPIR